jgi:phosphatidylglycerol:prolipoprotein diacylglycerol transferase
MPAAAIPFPNIDDVLFSVGPFAFDLFGGFEVGPLQIRWYALSYIAGLLFAWFYTKRLVATPSLWAKQAPA